VLLSRGANPDIASLRGRLSPLHLACGAGNFAIVELLVRHGCALQVRDTLGSSPVDHALRNGFPLLAQWMKDKIGDDKERRAENRAMEEQRMIECDEISSADIKASNVNYNDVEIEDKKFLLQSAFANLSLKDKLMLNMMVKKRREKIKKGHIPNKIIKEALNESGSESGDEYVTEKMDESSSYHEELTTKYARTSRKDESGDDHVGSVISETDKESLDIAMRLMNEEVRILYLLS
jgi:ankyrin repeat protein